MATRKPAVKKTAKQLLAEAMEKVERLTAEAAAEDIEAALNATSIAAEFRKLRKGSDGKDVKDIVIFTAIAKAVEAKGVEIKAVKSAPRKPRDPSKPPVQRKRKSTVSK
jgi:hypothetical protein